MSFGVFYTVLAAFEGIAVWGGLKNVPVRKVLDHIDGTIQRLANLPGVAIGKITRRCLEHYICAFFGFCIRLVPCIPILFFVLSPIVILGCVYYGFDIEKAFKDHETGVVKVGFWICFVQLILFLIPKLWFMRYKSGVLSDAKPKADALAAL